MGGYYWGLICCYGFYGGVSGAFFDDLFIEEAESIILESSTRGAQAKGPCCWLRCLIGVFEVA